MASGGYGRLIGGGVFCGLMLTACGQSPQTAPSAVEAAENARPAAFVWPAGFRLMDEGFPAPGDPCRRLGETELTSNYLDDSARLIGCPGSAGDNATTAIVVGLGGKVVGGAEGVTLISIPMGDANQGMPAG
jgi:hypothetical protein